MTEQLDRIEKKTDGIFQRLSNHGERLAKIESRLDFVATPSDVQSAIETHRTVCQRNSTHLKSWNPGPSRAQYTGIAKVITAVGAAIAAALLAIAWITNF